MDAHSRSKCSCSCLSNGRGNCTVNPFNLWHWRGLAIQMARALERVRGLGGQGVRGATGKSGSWEHGGWESKAKPNGTKASAGGWSGNSLPVPATFEV